eukprot:CAMPEP_0178909942 /NCGR_PEP_ID=MMETSP0786-20121207/8818_1 /TAXON_ID=186022 /ORGANISM="Thalassionema frauenfeldii, Strain CCMP 1798" /LENGTH=626 /DNA_ID=CAMNT_0020582131 /DNA_START=388 /DNA_END=2268 /DNA_ORIENTATION=+
MNSSSKVLFAFIIIIIIAASSIAGHYTVVVQGDSSSSSSSPRKLRRHRTKSNSNAFTWQLNTTTTTTTTTPNELTFSPVATITPQDIFDNNDNDNDDEDELWQSRIVGGVTSPVDAYPFYVNWGGQCGASLIGREWLMSAAHCDPISTNTVRINRSRGIGYTVGRGDIHSIIDRFPHPQYNNGYYTHDNDIMLLRLSEPVMEYDPIPLNFQTNIPQNGQDLKVIGFGRLESGGNIPNTLQEVVVQYVDTDTCNDNDSYSGSINDDTMFCAGVPGGGKDSCQGDSGGPIFTMNTNNDSSSSSSSSSSSYTQVGVVSWGHGCARPDKPGVYARVSQYEQWIKDLICNDEEHYTQYKPDFCGNDNDDGGFTWPVAPPTPVANRPTTTPTAGGNNNNNNNVVVEIQLRITYDDYPDETSWTFEQDNVEVGRGDGTSSFPGDQSTYSYYGLQPGPALFRIRDTMQDGICCGYGIGSYEIVAIIIDNDNDDNDNGQPVSIEDSTGEFGASEQISFVVPGSTDDDDDPITPQPTRPPTSQPTNNSGNVVVPTRPPTSQPTTTTNNNNNNNNNCRDSSTAEFGVDSNVGTQNCDWLSSNTDNFQYLCQFFDVANKCKVTCNVCQYFEDYAANNQ